MKLTVNEGARKHFDSIATALRDALVERRPNRRPPTSWEPDVEPKASVTDSDLQAPIIESGPEGIFQHTETGTRCLPSEKARQFFDLCERLWKATRPQRTVGAEGIVRVAQAWLFSSDTAEFTDYCLAQLETALQHFDIWLPIAALHIESPLDVADVTFRELGSQRVDAWHQTLRSNAATEDWCHVDAYIKKLRQQVQGYAAGVMSIRAEETCAQDTARHRVGDALAMLRFFSLPARTLYRRSYCVLRGMDHLATYMVLHEVDGLWAGCRRGLVDQDPHTWWLRTAEIENIRSCGLDTLGGLLHLGSPSGFQSAVLASVRLFSDSTLESRVETRLVLLLAALEGLFLKDPSEPIQQNLGERLAMLVRTSPSDRRQVIGLVKRVYSQRSKFAHHARAVRHDADLESFVDVAWHGVLAAIRNANAFRSVREFADSIDEMKLS
jgi:hypothetical protein